MEGNSNRDDRSTYSLIVSPLCSPIRDSDSDMQSDTDYSDQCHSSKVFCTGCQRMLKRKHMKILPCDWNHGLCKVKMQCAMHYRDYRCPVCTTDLRQNRMTLALEQSLESAREDNICRQKNEWDRLKRESLRSKEIERESEAKESDSDSEYELMLTVRNNKRPTDVEYAYAMNVKRNVTRKIIEDDVWTTLVRMGEVQGRETTLRRTFHTSPMNSDTLTDNDRYVEI